jgi:Asp-tRNA(Asn)/Glu-tRNA(Gln) amidotransferase A subunit family amidase
LTLPLQTRAGLPAGLQLVGPRGADAALCAMAHVIIG